MMSSGWSCTLCRTMFANRQNALKHLRTLHRPPLSRHRTYSNFWSSDHYQHRRLTSKYVMLSKDYVPDEYLKYIKEKKTSESKRKRHNESQKSDSSSSSASESANAVDNDCISTKSGWPNDPKDVSNIDGYEYFIGEHRVRIVRRENDSFEVCIGTDDCQSKWPCPQCKLPFRTPNGLATHLRYLYEGFWVHFYK